MTRVCTSLVYRIIIPRKTPHRKSIEIVHHTRIKAIQTAVNRNTALSILSILTSDTKMLLSLILALVIFVSSASAAVDRFCAAFEPPPTGHFLEYLVTSSYENTSVLILHIRDMKEEFINTVKLDERVTLHDGDYPVRLSEPMAIDTQSPCTPHTVEALDTKQIIDMSKPPEFPILDVTLKPGDQALYRVPTAGVYCAIVSQDSTEKVEGVQFIPRHFYGEGLLTEDLELKVALFGALVLLFHISAFPALFPSVLSWYHEEDTWAMLRHTAYGSLIVMLIKIFWNYPAMYGWFWNDSLFKAQLSLLGEWDLLEGILSFMMATVVYRTCTGIFPHQSLAHRPEMSPQMMGAFCSAVILLMINTLNEVFLAKYTDAGFLSLLSSHILAGLHGVVFLMLHFTEKWEDKNQSKNCVTLVTCKSYWVPTNNVCKCIGVFLSFWGTFCCTTKSPADVCGDDSLPCYPYVVGFLDGRVRYHHIIGVCYFFESLKAIIYTTVGACR